MPRPFAVPGAAEIIAHRGYSARAPENTVVALEWALDAGADAVEFDLHVARDGTPYLFHDDTLDRTTDGTGPFADCSPAHLDALDAGAWFGDEFAGEPVPTLERALDAMGGRVGRVYAEIKRYRALADVDRIVDVTRAAGLLEDTVFISMSWEALGRVRAYDARIGIGYIIEDVARVALGLGLATADPNALLDFDARILLADPTLAARAHELDIELATWTVDAPEDAARLLEMGVPRITTNRVGALVDWKATL